MDRHFQDEESQLYHKSFDIFIQRRFSKLFFINKFDPTGS